MQPKMHISAGGAVQVVHPPVKVVVYKKLCKTDFDCNLLLHCCTVRTIVMFTRQYCCDIYNDVFNNISNDNNNNNKIAIYCCIAAHHHNVATVVFTGMHSSESNDLWNTNTNVFFLYLYVEIQTQIQLQMQMQMPIQIQ